MLTGSRNEREPPAGRSLTRRGARYANRRGIEQQQVGTGADRVPAAIGNAVEASLMTCQTPHAFRQIERATLAHPVPEEIKPEPASHR